MPQSARRSSAVSHADSTGGAPAARHGAAWSFDVAYLLRPLKAALVPSSSVAAALATAASNRVMLLNRRLRSAVRPPMFRALRRARRRRCRRATPAAPRPALDDIAACAPSTPGPRALWAIAPVPSTGRRSVVRHRTSRRCHSLHRADGAPVGLLAPLANAALRSIERDAPDSCGLLYDRSPSAIARARAGARGFVSNDSGDARSARSRAAGRRFRPTSPIAHAAAERSRRFLCLKREPSSTACLLRRTCRSAPACLTRWRRSASRPRSGRLKL